MVRNVAPGSTVNIADEGQPPVLMPANRKVRRAAMADARRQERKKPEPAKSREFPGLPR